MDRVDRALDDHWQDRKGPEYEREMQAAAREQPELQDVERIIKAAYRMKQRG